MRTRLLVVNLVFAMVVASAVVASAGVGSRAAAAGRQIDVVVTTPIGTPVVGATIRIGSVSDITDSAGRVRLTGAGAGTITISSPGRDDQNVRWAGFGDRVTIIVTSPVRRAVHVAGSIPGTPRWQELLDLADRTALNAVMLDIKDESGRVFPASASAWAAAAGSVLGRWDLPEVVDETHSRGLDVIARIVAFQDPLAGRRLPGIAALNVSTGGPYTKNGQVFLDPTDPDARAYALELAAEACAAGVDEVQFDYVRFPDGIFSGVRFDGGSSPEVRVATITGFLAEARSRMPSSCDVAADIFGFITSIDGGGGIGQKLTALDGVLDVVSPMVYPNHWGPGWFGFDVPANHPGPVVEGSSRNAIERLSADGTIVRPWLQDFGGYGPTQLRAQIDAADSLGLGWMIWNAGSRFSEAGIPTDEEMPPVAVPPRLSVRSRPLSQFWDVPDTSTFFDDVAWLGSMGITKGCNPPWRDDFCPRRILSRGEAATMLVRALDLPSSPVDRFDDDNGSTHEDAINSLAAAGITNGCGPDRFCPNVALNRAQMAALLARALDLPEVVADSFVDDDDSKFQADIERIAAVGITRGCAADKFCPAEPVLREQVAAFLHRALTG